MSEPPVTVYAPDVAAAVAAIGLLITPALLPEPKGQPLELISTDRSMRRSRLAIDAQS